MLVKEVTAAVKPELHSNVHKRPVCDYFKPLNSLHTFTPYFSNKFNIKLKKLQNAFPHVKILETTSERSYYTKHGLHFNDSGREHITGMICELIKSCKLSNEVILPMEWTKEEAFETTKEMDLYTQSTSLIDCDVKIDVCTDKQSNIDSDNCADPSTKINVRSHQSCDMRRTSARERKNPANRNSDFLW